MEYLSVFSPNIAKYGSEITPLLIHEITFNKFFANAEAKIR